MALTYERFLGRYLQTIKSTPTLLLDNHPPTNDEEQHTAISNTITGLNNNRRNLRDGGADQKTLDELEEAISDKQKEIENIFFVNDEINLTEKERYRIKGYILNNLNELLKDDSLEVNARENLQSLFDRLNDDSIAIDNEELLEASPVKIKQKSPVLKLIHEFVGHYDDPDRLNDFLNFINEITPYFDTQGNLFSFLKFLNYLVNDGVVYIGLDNGGVFDADTFKPSGLVDFNEETDFLAYDATKQGLKHGKVVLSILSILREVFSNLFVCSHSNNDYPRQEELYQKISIALVEMGCRPDFIDFAAADGIDVNKVASLESYHFYDGLVAKFPLTVAPLNLEEQAEDEASAAASSAAGGSAREKPLPKAAVRAANIEFMQKVKQEKGLEGNFLPEQALVIDDAIGTEQVAVKEGSCGIRIGNGFFNVFDIFKFIIMGASIARPERFAPYREFIEENVSADEESNTLGAAFFRFVNQNVVKASNAVAAINDETFTVPANVEMGTTRQLMSSAVDQYLTEGGYIHRITKKSGVNEARKILGKVKSAAHLQASITAELQSAVELFIQTLAFIKVFKQKVVPFFSEEQDPKSPHWLFNLVNEHLAIFCEHLAEVNSAANVYYTSNSKIDGRGYCAIYLNNMHDKIKTLGKILYLVKSKLQKTGDIGEEKDFRDHLTNFESHINDSQAGREVAEEDTDIHEINKNFPIQVATTRAQDPSKQNADLILDVSQHYMDSISSGAAAAQAQPLYISNFFNNIAGLGLGPSKHQSASFSGKGKGEKRNKRSFSANFFGNSRRNSGGSSWRNSRSGGSSSSNSGGDAAAASGSGRPEDGNDRQQIPPAPEHQAPPPPSSVATSSGASNAAPPPEPSRPAPPPPVAASSRNTGMWRTTAPASDTTEGNADNKKNQRGSVTMGNRRGGKGSSS